MHLLCFLLLALYEASAFTITPKYGMNKYNTLPRGECQQVPVPRMAMSQNESGEVEARVDTRSRRKFINVTAMTLGLPFLDPRPSNALKPKNENLCGTGLFEHFQEYRCTPIGNILDEGVSKDLTESDAGLTDSLMGKLGISSENLKRETVEETLVGKKNGPDKKSKVPMENGRDFL